MAERADKDVNLVAIRRSVSVAAGAPDHAGAVDPNDINMKGLQALFAIIGTFFVLGAIWFFFWAKNGGFKFRKGDWDEYKSTVLRRKGPNGTTLSNATKSTVLGGGSVVGDGYSDRDTYADETSTVYTGTMTELSSSTAPIIKEKRSKKARSRRDHTAKERKQREMKEAQFEGGHDADVRAYMREKPATVGGINAASDTMHYGTDYTETEPSAYSGSHVGSHSPHHPPPQSEHPSAPPSHYAPSHYERPVERDYTHRSPRHPSPEKQSRKSTDTRSAPGRRDFSYTINSQHEQEQFSVAPSERSVSPPPLRVPAQNHTQPPPPTYPATHQPGSRYSATRGNVPGGYAQSQSSYTSAGTGYTQPLSELQQSNTKSYHHPIPGLKGQPGRQGGFRRGAGTDLDD